MSGTFPTSVTPDYTFTEIDQYRVLVSSIWGKERTRDKWGDSKKIFKLFFNHITKGEADYIWAFFVSQKGNYSSFTWTHPVTAVEYTVRFSSSDLKRDEVGPDAFNIECEIVEVL